MTPEEFRTEIEAHLAMERDRLIAEGLSPEEADAAARRSFGNITAARERFHEARPWVVRLEQIREDLRYAARLLWHAPGFTAIAVLSLALGIGANTALFSVVHTLLLKSLPYRDADRLVYVTEYWPHEPIVPGPPAPAFANWHANSKLAEAIAAYGGGADALNLVGSGEPERLQGTMVTYGLLHMIGARLALGRDFSPEEDRIGAAPTVILGYELWQRKFGTSPDVLGKVIQLGGVDRTIVGVLSSGFAFPDNNFRSELLIPMGLPVNSNWRDDRNFRLLRVAARLKPGVEPSAFREELTSLVRSIASQEPPQMVTMRKDMEIRVTPLRDWLTSGVKRTILVLQAAVAMLLLIACLNIAGLQVARSIARQKEMALRAAVGAHRIRLMQQFLTESLLLSGIGGCLGLIFGYSALPLLRAFLPANLHLADAIHIDATTLWVTFGIAVAAGLIAGLAPALLASNPQLHQSMKSGLARSKGHQQLHGALVVAEIAVAVVLLVGAGLFVRTFIQLASLDPGFRPEGILTARISLPQRAYPDATKWRAFFSALSEKAQAIPGVESAVVAGGLPLIGTRAAAGVAVEGQLVAPLGGRPSIPIAGTGLGYFQALGIPILRGRAFTPADENGPSIVIVNQAFAERFFPGQDALGKRIEAGSRKGLWREIVGIAGNVKQQGRRPVDSFVIYAPLNQMIEQEELLILKSSSIPPAQLVHAAAEAVHSVDPNQPLFDVATERLGQTLSTQRANMTLMGAFAALALILSTIGIFGMIAYLAGRRTREIGIRLALGASRASVVSGIVNRGMVLTAAGLTLGVTGALLLSRCVGSLLEGIQTTDPLSYISVAILFAGVAVAACFIPAKRASNVDPMTILRHE